MSNQPQRQQITVIQKGGCQNGCMIGLGIIAAIIFVVFVLPAGCTIFAGKAIIDEAKKQNAMRPAPSGHSIGDIPKE